MRAVTVLAASFIAIYGVFIDYSDMHGHVAGAIVLVVVAIAIPRIAATVATSYVLLILVVCSAFHAIDRLPHDFSIGLTRDRVTALLGEPAYSGSSMFDIPDIGFARPSPWRFKRQVVTVHLRGDRATWVFYDSAGRVADYFVGGS